MERAYIITESETDKAILEKILSEQAIEGVKFVSGNGKSSAHALASSILAVNYIPVALVIDADTAEERKVWEEREILDYLLKQASGGVPYGLFLAIPEIETLFIHDMDFIEKLAPNRSFSKMEEEFAQLHPKKFLSHILGQEKVNVKHVLDRLDEQTIKKLQLHPLIVQLSEFLQKIPLTTPIPS